MSSSTLNRSLTQAPNGHKRLGRRWLVLASLVLLSLHLMTAWALRSSAARPDEQAVSAQHAYSQRMLLASRVEIARYQAYEGKLPGSLETMVSEGYINHAPKDGWGRPLRYFLTSEGSYILFSVGADGVALSKDDLMASALRGAQVSAR